MAVKCYIVQFPGADQVILFGVSQLPLLKSALPHLCTLICPSNRNGLAFKNIELNTLRLHFCLVGARKLLVCSIKHFTSVIKCYPLFVTSTLIIAGEVSSLH